MNKVKCMECGRESTEPCELPACPLKNEDAMLKSYGFETPSSSTDEKLLQAYDLIAMSKPITPIKIAIVRDNAREFFEFRTLKGVHEFTKLLSRDGLFTGEEHSKSTCGNPEESKYCPSQELAKALANAVSVAKDAGVQLSINMVTLHN